MFTLENHYSQVSAILPKDRAYDIVKESIPELMEYSVTISSRGSKLRESWVEWIISAVSPEQTIVDVLVQNKNVDAVMNNIASVAGLTRGGVGGVFSVPCDGVYFSKEQNRPEQIETKENLESEFNAHLMAIYCIVQKGKAERLAAAAMRQGSPGPTVSYGEGHGVRDRMGIWRFAINPEKELVRLIVSTHEFEGIYKSLNRAGRFHIPGMGFIHAVPVTKGIINIPSRIRPRNRLATDHQIVKAIDEIKGSSAWRAKLGYVKGATSEHIPTSGYQKLSLTMDTSHSDKMVQELLGAGAPGLSLNYGREFLPSETKGESGIQLSKDLAIMEMVIPDAIQGGVLDAIHSVAQSESLEGFHLFTQKVTTSLAG